MPPRGFTLVEVVLSLVLLGIGVTAAARAAQGLARATAHSALLTEVARAGNNLLETLPWGGCAPRSGRSSGHVVDLVWTVTVADSVGQVSVVATWPGRNGMRADTFETAFLC